MLLFTGDRDMYQLATENVKIVSTKKGVSDVAIMTPESVDDLYHGRLLGIQGTFMAEYAHEVAVLLGAEYPELVEKSAYWLNIVLSCADNQRKSTVLSTLLAARNWTVKGMLSLNFSSIVNITSKLR